MSRKTGRGERLLAIDPISRGFGYVVLESSPVTLLDWGVKHCGRRTARVRTSINALLLQYRPTQLVLAAHDTARSATRRLALSAWLRRILLACPDRCDVHQVTRANLIAFTRAAGIRTKADATRHCLLKFPELLRSIPPRRQPWQSEDSRHAVFDAAILAMSVAELSP